MLEQQPAETTLPPRDRPLPSEFPWIWRYTLMLVATSGTLLLLAIVFKSPPTLQTEVQASSPTLPVGEVPIGQTPPGKTGQPPSPQKPGQSQPVLQTAMSPSPDTSQASPPPSPSVNPSPQQPIPSEDRVASSAAPPLLPPASHPHPKHLSVGSTVDRTSLPQETPAILPQQAGEKPAELLMPSSRVLTQSSSTADREIPLTLREAIILGLENNIDIKNAYLDRIVHKEELRLAESTFSPRISPSVSVSLVRDRTGNNISNAGDLGLSAGLEIKIPTGGAFNFRWGNSGQFVRNLNNDLLNPNFQMSFTQPLLKGAGVEINRVPVEIARLTENRNIEQLKATLIETITGIILTYRNLLQAQEELNIQQDSLKKAQEILTINLALIEAGRVAPIERFQYEATVANRRLSLLQVENRLESSRLELVNLLNINRELKVRATENLILDPVALDVEKLIQLALARQPNYIQSQLNQKIATLALLRDRNNRRWDLSFNVDYQGDYNSNSLDSAAVSAGLTLKHTFGDRTPEVNFQRSRINLLKAENTLENLQQNLKGQVRDRVREVELSFKRVEAAQQARSLDERNLTIAQERLKLGKANVLEIVDLQDRLLNARTAELSAVINYLNALTVLDRTIGTTLESWEVQVLQKNPGRE